MSPRREPEACLPAGLEATGPPLRSRTSLRSEHTDRLLMACCLLIAYRSRRAGPDALALVRAHRPAARVGRDGRASLSLSVSVAHLARLCSADGTVCVTRGRRQSTGTHGQRIRLTGRASQAYSDDLIRMTVVCLLPVHFLGKRYYAKSEP